MILKGTNQYKQSCRSKSYWHGYDVGVLRRVTKPNPYWRSLKFLAMQTGEVVQYQILLPGTRLQKHQYLW